MFVRFERRTHVGAHSKHTRYRRLEQPWSSLVVCIVESRRIDGRSSRQKVVAYLGTIRCVDLNVPSACRRFWDGVAERLAEFSPQDRQRFENAIAARISRPSLAEVLKATKDRMLARARIATLRATTSEENHYVNETAV